MSKFARWLAYYALAVVIIIYLVKAVPYFLVGLIVATLYFKFYRR